MNINILAFEEQIVAAVRAAATKGGVPRGAIGVKWVFPDGDAMRENMVIMPLVPGGSTLYYDADGNLVGDCAEYARMKIRAADKAAEYWGSQSNGVRVEADKYTSRAMPEQFNDDMRINWGGGVRIDIGILVGGECGMRGELWGKVIVAVSGGTEDQDEEAAWAALPIVKSGLSTYISDGQCMMLAVCFYDKLRSMDALGKTE